MSNATPSAKKRAGRPLHVAAHIYASKRKEPGAASSWNDSERGAYWWGLFEGYQAGIRAQKRKQK